MFKMNWEPAIGQTAWETRPFKRREKGCQGWPSPTPEANRSLHSPWKKETERKCHQDGMFSGPGGGEEEGRGRNRVDRKAETRGVSPWVGRIGGAPGAPWGLRKKIKGTRERPKGKEEVPPVEGKEGGGPTSIRKMFARKLSAPTGEWNRAWKRGSPIKKTLKKGGAGRLRRRQVAQWKAQH